MDNAAFAKALSAALLDPQVRSSIGGIFAESIKQELVALRAEVKQKNAIIDQLKRRVDDLESTNDDLEQYQRRNSENQLSLPFKSKILTDYIVSASGTEAPRMQCRRNLKNSNIFINEDLTHLLSVSIPMFPEHLNHQMFNDLDPDSNILPSINNKIYSYNDLPLETNYNNQFSLFHSNIRSLPQNNPELMNCLKLTGLHFSIIALTETWLNPETKDIYDIPDYNSIHATRTDRRGGGSHYS
ncbi:hypothetical protein CAPTEDRAFT_213168 [Capitella teleta]|uniref:Uncharacterized protein n=1 Tax=Capitella teleta TaxID=283909 RepID=R7T337_CAPTE|nr:hypothetical protein CAPTEDRAFT_213168 [Capitella teleta]|eukprot:ELT86983.1 hypothetical protein CAPTEDRAFT_213168 [Capitella teleta]